MSKVVSSTAWSGSKVAAGFLDLHHAPEFAARLPFVQTTQRPHRFAPGGVPRGKRACDREVFERFLCELRASGEVEHVLERSGVERGLKLLALRFAKAANEVKP